MAGWIDLIGVSGSAVGLVIAGYWAGGSGRLADPITWLAAATLGSAVIVAALFPETAARELEEFNPSDPVR